MVETYVKDGRSANLFTYNPANKKRSRKSTEEMERYI
jgi:hypothetical protein